MILLFQSSFRLSEKNEKDKKRGLWLAETGGEKRLLNNFSSLKSTKKEKLHYVSLRANDVRPLSRRRRPRSLRESVNSRPTIELKPRNSQKKKHLPHPLFLLQKRAQKKKLSKRNPRYFYRGFLRGFILSWREPLPHISLLRQTSRSRRQDRSERNIRSTQPQREASLQPPA